MGGEVSDLQRGKFSALREGDEASALRKAETRGGCGSEHEVAEHGSARSGLPSEGWGRFQGEHRWRHKFEKNLCKTVKKCSGDFRKNLQTYRMFLERKRQSAQLDHHSQNLMFLMRYKVNFGQIHLITLI